jgi:hypothetical protein
MVVRLQESSETLVADAAQGIGVLVGGGRDGSIMPKRLVQKEKAPLEG